MRKEFFIASFMVSVLMISLYFILPEKYLLAHLSISFIFAVILLIGLHDAFHKKHAIKRNFPIFGNFRYLLESIRPEIQQYFIERNTDGKPYSREERSVVYQRSKNELDTVPFGTQQNVYNLGYEWVNHSIAVKHVDHEKLRVTIGSKDCKKPYDASLLNISAMSYGSLNKNAILALSKGASLGNFAHNTGEGSISPYHLEGGADLIWQIGTGYFGCRKDDGTFSDELFEEKAKLEAVKMIEIKISQGAKPGHGGILPKGKITPEISKIRGVSMDEDVISPPTHSSFTTPLELLQFIQKCRELSGGKPVGIKLCIGKRREFMSICKAMIKLDIFPDFITVDGGEGGTGAAPIEFTNNIGTPSVDGLIFVHNCLVGFNIRNKVKIVATGKITTAFSIIKLLALGADLTYSARSMMLALGCIQALRCNANVCPAGIATNNPHLMQGLVVDEKYKRVYNFHRQTLKSVAEMLGAMGLSSGQEVRPWHIVTRYNAFENRNYKELFDFVSAGDFLKNQIPGQYKDAFERSHPDSFEYIGSPEPMITGK